MRTPIHMLLWALGTLPLAATQHALLVGVSAYSAGEGRLNLEGPRQDIASFRRILVERLRLQPDNIKELVDRRATKTNILEALNTLTKELKPGDSLLFYFSGHGTSAFDKANQPIAAVIGPNSGALVPYDLDMSSPDTVSKTLIIGRRDLRPLLQQAHPKSSVFVILDSCYSGNAAKSAGPSWEGPSRAINVVSEMSATARASASFTGPAKAEPAPDPSAKDEPDTYPYSNVVAFSAASKSEPARDINTAMLQSGKYDTFDGLPHGAFSNALLSALDGQGDANRDGQFTYGELFRYIRESVQQNHKQTPQVQLPSEAALNLPAFSTKALPPATTPRPRPANPAAIRLAVEGASAADQQKLAAIPGVALSTGAHDLLVRKDSTGWALFHRSHFLIRRYPQSNFAELAQRIAAQADVRALEEFHFPASTFLLALDAKPIGRAVEAGAPFSARYRIGEEFSLSASLEQQAYLLVLNIDARGKVDILLPSPREPQPVAARKITEILRVRAAAPAGSDTVRAFAFSAQPAGWNAFACKQVKQELTCPELLPGSPEFGRLLTMLRSASGANQSATLRLETVE